MQINLLTTQTSLELTSLDDQERNKLLRKGVSDVESLIIRWTFVKIRLMTEWCMVSNAPQKFEDMEWFGVKAGSIDAALKPYIDNRSKEY